MPYMMKSPDLAAAPAGPAASWKDVSGTEPPKQESESASCLPASHSAESWNALPSYTHVCIGWRPLGTVQPCSALHCMPSPLTCVCTPPPPILQHPSWLSHCTGRDHTDSVLTGPRVCAFGLWWLGVIQCTAV